MVWKIVIIFAIVFAFVVGGKKLVKILGKSINIKKPNKDSEDKCRLPNKEPATTQNNKKLFSQKNSRTQNNTMDYLKKIKKYHSELSVWLLRVSNYKIDKVAISEFEEKLGECFIKWKELQKMELDKTYADIVLTNYYANEKIRGKLQDFCEYVENELEEEENSGEVVLCGFNTCMNFAWLDYKKMKGKLDNIFSNKEKLSEDDNLLAFLQELSYLNSSLGDLYQAYVLGKNRISGDEIAYSDRELYLLLNKVMNRMKEYDSASDNFGFENILQDLELKKNKKTHAISEAKALESALDDLMKESDLLEMKNKESDLETMKALYQKMNEKTKSILNHFKH